MGESEREKKRSIYIMCTYIYRERHKERVREKENRDHLRGRGDVGKIPVPVYDNFNSPFPAFISLTYCWRPDEVEK